MKAWTPTSTHLKLFAYGAAGAGKTTLFSTALDDVRTKSMLWLNCGGNPESIRTRPDLPPILTIEQISDLNPIYDWLVAGQPIPVDGDGKRPHPFVVMCGDMGIELSPPYNTVVFDGLTEFQRIAVNEVAGNKSKGPGDKLEKTSLPEWGEALNRLVHVTRLMFNLPMNVLFSCLEDDRSNPDGIVKTIPWLWGQARDEVPAYALCVGRVVRTAKITTAAERAKMVGAYSTLYIDQVGQFDAKQQYVQHGPAFIAEPTITKLLDALAIGVTGNPVAEGQSKL